MASDKRPPTVSLSDWLHPAEVDDTAGIRLLLFHYSGGGISMYAQWRAWLPSDIAVQRVQLPGRQQRVAEPPFTALAPLVDELVQVLDAELDDRPYALFGHSMGALVAYRLVVAAGRRGRPSPTLLGVSGWSPVGFDDLDGGADQSDDDIIRELQRIGSPVIAQLTSAELRTLVIPTMRADLSVCRSHVDDGAVVDCPIVTYSGRDDLLVTPAGMGVWANRTRDYLGNRQFLGDHFFIHEQGRAIATDLAQLLYTHARRGAPHSPHSRPFRVE